LDGFLPWALAASSNGTNGTNALLVLAVLLVAGVASGIVARRMHLPAVTGQIFVGILLGPVLRTFDIHLFGHETVQALEPIMKFALGLMAVAVGSHLHLRKLHNAKKRLSWLLLFEATLTPALVFLVVMLTPGADWTMAMLLATLAISTAPATILAVVKETRSKGTFVKTLIAATALNNIAAITLFEIAHTVTRDSLDPSTLGEGLGLLIHPLATIFLSVLLGVSVGLVLIFVTRKVVRSDRLTTLSLIAIVLTVGIASQFEIFSTLLSCLILGVVLSNLTPDKDEIGHEVFANFEHAIFAIFFTVAGLELEFSYIVPGGLIALLVFAARFVGKWLSATLAMRISSATDSLRRYLGAALIPQAGLAVGLMLLVTEDGAFGSIRNLFLAIVLTVVTLNEIVGPLLTRLALKRSGDFGKDRPRIIDFLHEENIATDLSATTMPEAIEQLTDLVIRSHDLKVDRAALLASILDRERQDATLLGDGLAIPTGEIEEGDGIVGVMGISSEGLDLGAPDDHPVHCMVLLVTPRAARTRHLEVLAAFARTIAADRVVQQQLFHAHSPAHAYDLLHAEEAADDYNYFLED
jgi:Kef-type K+ transport system membrane component KefB/mannitol/fructose-specific phosphotransferase system IIA component (Ntr-type)